MLPRGGGAIVNVVSVNAFFQPDGLVIDYGASKAPLSRGQTTGMDESSTSASRAKQKLGHSGIRT
jgi:NAD(P)-dependent dehydrogenase (short-subunit alcohol dehydrogenase family)